MSERNMTCQELSDSYELYALGTLEGDEREELQAHLARGCQNCQRGIANAQVLNTGIMSFVEVHSPPRRLKRRVMASVGLEKPGWGWVWALASACLLVLAVWLGLQERDRTNELADARQQLLQAQSERNRLTQAMQFLSDPRTLPASFGRGETAPPRGYVFMNSQMGVLLIASNLPAAGQGKTYEMWVIPKGGDPRPAGLFQSDGTRGVHILSGPMDTTTVAAVAVTVEPEAGSLAPTTKPIIVAPVT